MPGIWNLLGVLLSFSLWGHRSAICTPLRRAGTLSSHTQQPQFALVSVHQYETCLAGLGRQLFVRVSRLPKRGNQGDRLSPAVAYTGLPADEYFNRAKFVFSRRTKTWSLARSVGEKCSKSLQRCSLHLHCVGPDGKLKCQEPILWKGRCDGKYKVCKEGLYCRKGKCLLTKDKTVKKLFKWLKKAWKKKKKDKHKK